MKFFIRTLFVSALFLNLNNQIFASCGASSCPIDTFTTEATQKGQIRLDYSYEYIDQHQPQIGRHDATVGEISGHHDEVSTLSETKRIGLSAGLTDRFSLDLVLPTIHREHQHIHHHMGEDLTESWNFDGLGDLQAILRTTLIKPTNIAGTTVSLLTGGKLPTGRTHAANNEGDEAEVGILPGKGAYSFIAGASYLKTTSVKTAHGDFATLPFFISTTYEWNQPGVDEYRMGNTWLFNTGVTYPLFSKLGLIGQINTKIARKDDRGNTREEVEKTGGSYVYASPGIQLTLAEGLVSFVIVQIPVYQRVNSIQLTSDYNFTAGLSYKFSVL